MADLVLNGIATRLDSAEGKAFILDATRAGESVLSDDDLKLKYLLSDADLKNISKNAAVARAVRACSAERVRSGRAAQESAAKHFSKAPGYLNEILADPKAHPKFRIESAKELRATAVGNNSETPNNSERFTININLGSGHSLHNEYALPKVKELTAGEIDWGWRDNE
jgi:hypothetical protein